MANEYIDPKDVVIDDQIDAKDVIRDGDEEIWGPKRSDMLRMRQAFHDDDPLGVLDAKRRMEIEPRIKMERDPEEAARRVALSAYFSRMRRRDIGFVYDNLDGIMEQYAGKKTSVKEMYNEIRGLMSPGSVKPGIFEIRGLMSPGSVKPGIFDASASALKSGMYKQNETVWNALATAGRLIGEGLAGPEGGEGTIEGWRSLGKWMQESARKQAKLNQKLAQEEAEYARMNPSWFMDSDGIGDWMRNAWLTVVQTGPQILTQAAAAGVSGGGSLAMIGAYTANDKYYELTEEHGDMGPAQIAANVIGTGLINGLLEKVSVGIISGKLAQRVAKEGIKKGAAAIFKYFGLAFVEEAASEGLEQFSENCLDVLTGAKNKEIGEGVPMYRILLEGVGESAIAGGISGMEFGLGGYKSLREYNTARVGLVNQLEAESGKLKAIENPSEEEIRMLKTCETALESGDTVQMFEAAREIAVRDSLDVARKREADEERTIEDDALEAKRNNALRHGALMHNPQDTYDAVARAAEGYNIRVNAISGSEGLTSDARAELERLGIDPEHVRAWYSPKEDAVYINAARVRSSEVPYLLLHEVAVHKGLPAVLGNQYDPVMDSIYGQYREEIEAVNEVYHYDLENEGERRAATEEYLAERAEFCGHDWRAYEKEHFDEVERYIAENGLSPENRRGAVRGLMEENGELAMRPSWWREFLQKVKMFFRKRKGFEDYRFTDQEIETLIMRGLRKTKGRGKRIGTDENGEVRFSIEDRDNSLERLKDVDMGKSIASRLDDGIQKGEYRLKHPEDRQKILDGAKKFYDEFSKKEIPLSNGHVAYFMPDKRAFARGDESAWAEYCMHAVTSGGEIVEGKDFRERLYNHTKFENLDRIEPIIREERAFYKLNDKEPQKDSVTFVGKMHSNSRMEVITRLDDYGNVNADLTEVTVLTTKKGMEEIPPSRPLTEVVEAVAQHQAAGFSPSTASIIPQTGRKVKGESERNPGNNRPDTPDKPDRQVRLSVDQTETEEFKRWFGDSKVVDDEGNPLVVYRGAEFDPLTQEAGKGIIRPEAYFTSDSEYARRYARNGGKVRAYYLNIRMPFDIRNPECLKDLKSIYPDHEFQRGKSGALDWGEASIVDGEFLKENFGDKYDGIIYDEGGDPTDNGLKHRGISYVPLNGGSQVKSATDNIGTFDEKNPDVRFSVESYSEEDWGNMVTFMKPYVGRAMERNDADYMRHLQENGFEVANEQDAHVVAAEALKANQRDAREAGKKAMFDWLILNDYWFGRVYDAIGKTDFLIRPSHRFVGEDFTGSYISPEFVKYSGKLKVKDKEAKLEKAKGYHSDELAKLIASKTGGDELQIEQDLIDYFRHLKKRSSKADKENGQLGLYDKYSEWKASSPMLNAKLDEKLKAEWEAEKAAQLEEDFISMVEHGTQIDSDWVKDNRELWKMLCKRFLGKEAPYNPAKKDLDALNAALTSYAKGWADAKAQRIEEKRKEFREFREKVLSSKEEALKLQDEALAFARKHLPKENQGEFARAIVALMKIDNTPTRKHPEGKRKEALEALFEKILARGEELRRKELLEDFEKRMKQMGMRADGSGKLIGRSDPETQAQIEKIIEAVKLDPDEVIMRTDELTQRLEAARDAGEEATEIEIELAILDKYGALYHKDLVDLEDASSAFRALAVTGRNNLKELIEKRARELEGKRNHIEDLVSRGEVSPQARRSKLWNWKTNKIKRGLAQSFWELNSLDSLLAYQNKPGEADKEVKSLQERINRADEEGKTLNRKDADALIEEIDRLFKVKGRYDRTTVLKALRERVEKTGVFRRQARADEKKFEYRRLTPEEAEEMLRDYDNGGKLLNDYEAEALRHQMRTRKYRMERKQSDYFRDGVTDPVIDEMLKMGDKDKEGMYYIPTIKFAGTRVEEALTQMEALYLRLLWDQKDVRYKLRFNGWDEESIAGLDAFLKPEVKELGKWMVEQLDADRAGIGKVYERLYFSRFPHEENYFPTVYDTSREGLNGRITVDLTQEGAGSQPMYSTPGAMKLRRFHLQEPKIADALTIFTNHRMMMNHFVSHGEIARELRGIYLNKRISETLRDVYGVDYYGTLKREIADFIHGGNADVRNNIVFTYMLNNWARIKMLWNVASGMKQMFGGVAYMKYGDISASAMAKGIADFWKHPVENAKHLMETEYFKNRWQSGMNREMRSLMDSTGLNSGKWQTLMRDFDGAGFFLLRFGDAFSTIAYGHAVYKYHYDRLIQERMSKADAERGALAEWRMATERTQQSGNISMLNSWQKGSSAQRLFTTFLSNPILLCQSHSRDIYNAIRERHKGSAISAAQKLMVSGLVSVIMTAIGQMFRHGVNFDKYELGNFAADALADEICGIPAIGPYMTAIFNALNGGREKSIPVLDDISRSVRSGYRIADKFDEEINEDTLKDAITILQGLGLVSAPAAQAGSIMREIRKIVRLTETDQ